MPLERGGYIDVMMSLFSGDVTLEGSEAGPDSGHVYYKGHPLCAETHGGTTTWDINACNVVCRMLGFSSASSKFSTDFCPYGRCPVGVPFALSGFKCTGSEAHIIDCPHDESISQACGTNGFTNSANSYDIIGIQCTGDFCTLNSTVV